MSQETTLKEETVASVLEQPARRQVAGSEQITQVGAPARTRTSRLPWAGIVLLTLLAALAAFLVVAAWFAVSYYCFTPAGIAGAYCTWAAQRLGILGIVVASSMILEWSLPPSLVLGFLAALLLSRRAPFSTRILVQVVIGASAGVLFLVLFFIQLPPG